jgi:hypothetical protein
MSRLPAPRAVSDFADRIDEAEHLREVLQALASLRRGDMLVPAR